MPRPLALSLGDPAGVGPELIAECWARREAEGLPPFAVFGGAEILQAAARARGLDLPIAEIHHPDDVAPAFAQALPVFPLPLPEPAYTPGEPSREGAALALASLEAATQAVASSAAYVSATGFAPLFAALVTAPIAKSRLAEVGFQHPGQTEFVAQACGVAAQDAVMMLAGPSLRTVPITVHIALAQVPAALSTALITRRASIAAAALARDFGIANPRLAIAALNPHAGEDGRMGTEEAAIIAPAIAALRAAGIDATGPHPADALFAPRMRATYDLAICMYHDQALIPLKTLDFDSGVNVTLGLPLIRTSPDHGTAYAIAGKGVADPGAMLAAIRMAGQCAERRASL